MPERDIYHDAARSALVKDGWTITHDPFQLKYGIRRLFVDLGAQKLFAATKQERKIVVEVKSFVSPSQGADLQEAIGAFAMYRDILAETHPDRELFLTIPKDVFNDIWSEPLGQLLIARQNLHLIVFNDKTETVEKWIP